MSKRTVVQAACGRCGFAVAVHGDNLADVAPTLARLMAEHVSEAHPEAGCISTVVLDNDAWAQWRAARGYA